MPSVESTVRIDRAPHAVFAFVSDYERDPTWRSEVIEMTFQGPEPTSIGRRVLEKSSVFGQRLETLSEVTEYEPRCQDRLPVDFRSDPRPFLSLGHAGRARHAVHLPP